jgi:hypothetical protein
MTAILHEIFENHFGQEVEQYGIKSIDTDTDIVYSAKRVPTVTKNLMLDFAKQIEKAEFKRGQTVRYERDENPQNFLDAEIRYITGIDIHGEQTQTTVKINGVDFAKIKPCDILAARSHFADFFEHYSLDENGN